jgi:hypothetical protein
MYKLLMSIILIIAFTPIFGQADKYTPSKQFDNVLFTDLVTFIEFDSDLKFHFKNEWVNGVTVSINQNSLLIPQLREQLMQKGISLYVEDIHIYLISGKEIITEIPDYKSSEKTIIEKHQEKKITEAEKSYLESKVIASTEIIFVGKSNELVPNKSCIVRGKIRDEASGGPLVGASVYIEEINYGLATDIDGNFQLSLKPGKYKVFINHITKKQKEIYVQVYSSGSLALEMSNDLKEINEVVVSANHKDNVKGMQMGYEHLTAKSIKEIPVVMGERDILKVATMLPGVENVGEGSSGFNVRGSAADQNMFYINKIPIYNISHLFGFFSAFSPDIVNDFTLYKGNIPAKYGGRLASIFNITTRQGNKKKFFGQGGISPITSHLSFEGPIVKDKTSVVVSWRNSYSDWILKRMETFDLKNSSAFFYDASLGVNSEINNKNLVKAFGYKSFDKFSISDKNDYKYSNSGASLSWKHLFSRSVTGDFSMVYSQYYFDNIEKSDSTTAYSHKYTIENFETTADFGYVSSKNHTILFGISSTYYKNNQGDVLPYGTESDWKPISLGLENGMEAALYISDEFDLLPRLSVMAGLRYSFFAELGPKNVNTYFNGPKEVNNIESVKYYKKGEIIKFFSEPETRASVKYTLTPNISLKASYNRLRQYIFMLTNTIALSPNDQWKLASSNIIPPVIDHVSFGWYQNLFNNRIETNIEVYQKWIHHIVEYKDGADFISSDPNETQILQGQQNAKGIEFMLKKRDGKLTGWMSYSYSRSFIQVNGNYLEERINNGKEYPSNFDRPHSFNLVLNNRFNRRYSLSANFVYTTGRPVTLPIAAYYSEDQHLLHYSERNEYRLPDYIRMDFSLNIEGNLKEDKVAHSFWMINVYNALGRKNAYSVYYVAEKGKLQGYKLSIFAQPIITVSWNYKFGNYLND